jgi:predicted nucleotide-binding protein (sugar kinase/HSP70/actin superfamily)
VRYGEDESCLAVKLVFGHIWYLLDRCDHLCSRVLWVGARPPQLSQVSRRA